MVCVTVISPSGDLHSMEFRQYLNLAKGSSYLKFITGIQYLLVDVLDVLIVNINLETHFEVVLRV